MTDLVYKYFPSLHSFDSRMLSVLIAMSISLPVCCGESDPNQQVLFSGVSFSAPVNIIVVSDNLSWGGRLSSIYDRKTHLLVESRIFAATGTPLNGIWKIISNSDGDKMDVVQGVDNLDAVANQEIAGWEKGHAPISFEVIRFVDGVDVERQLWEGPVYKKPTSITIKNGKGKTVRVSKNGKMLNVSPNGIVDGVKIIEIKDKTEENGLTTLNGELTGNYLAEMPASCEFKAEMKNGTIVSVKAIFPGLLARHVDVAEGLVDFSQMLQKHCGMTFNEFSAMVNK